MIKLWLEVIDKLRFIYWYVVKKIVNGICGIWELNFHKKNKGLKIKTKNL
jgi:hypothetical protein